MNEKKSRSIEEYLHTTGHLTYRNVGVSMLPLLRQGRDLFTLEAYRGSGLMVNDVILFKRSDGKYVLHRLIRILPDGTYETMGDNCVTSEKGIREENILGVMTSFDRKGKTIRVDNRWYLLYVKVWRFLTPVRVRRKRIRNRVVRIIRKFVPRR